MLSGRRDPFESDTEFDNFVKELNALRISSIMSEHKTKLNENED